jgi:hypothetical protein
MRRGARRRRPDRATHPHDSDGEAWEARYTLERQPDGSLEITGCSLLRAGQAA